MSLINTHAAILNYKYKKHYMRMVHNYDPEDLQHAKRDFAETRVVLMDKLATLEKDIIDLEWQMFDDLKMYVSRADFSDGLTNAGATTSPEAADGTIAPAKATSEERADVRQSELGENHGQGGTDGSAEKHVASAAAVHAQ